MAYKVLTLCDADANPVAVATVSQDITERRQLAQELREADRRKNEFLAMVSHELRNPLAPISNAVEVLRRSPADPAAVRSASAMLERQVGQMAHLVDDLLDVSRITRGTIELRKETIDLARVVEQAVEANRALYESMGQELTVRVAPEPIRFDADPTRVAQVIGNLLNNACKFTDRGGHISLSVERAGREAVVRVRDDGVGIVSADLDRIFDMFAQVDSTLERSRGGLGIGLTLVKRLVEMHEGTVAVHSEGPGRGTEVVVRLPLINEVKASPAEAVRPGPAGRGGRKRRILVVDDNLDGAESLAMLLKFSGHETHTAGDGYGALQAVSEFRPDVVLLDIGLPGMSGYDVCRALRQQPDGNDLMLIAVTGWGQDDDRQRSLDAGFDLHVVKPVDLKALLKMIQ
jgi:CheY-like chemotaxis protein